MARVQLALNVADLDSAIDFYSKLFDTPPAKIRPGYANFAVAEPPLKLVLIEKSGATSALNHLGVEVDSPDEVAAAHRRLTRHRLGTTVEDQVSGCYAVQDKVFFFFNDWSTWEIYTVLADADADAGGEGQGDPTTCC